MSKIEQFEDLDVWKDARLLVKDIYKITGKGSLSRDFSLKDQIQRASVSVMSNISEGFERESTKEFIRFLFIAKASAGELRSLLYIAYDVNCIDRETFQKLNSFVHSISKQIPGFIKYLKKVNRLKDSKIKDLRK